MLGRVIWRLGATRRGGGAERADDDRFLLEGDAAGRDGRLDGRARSLDRDGRETELRDEDRDDDADREEVPLERLALLLPDELVREALPRLPSLSGEAATDG